MTPLIDSKEARTMWPKWAELTPQKKLGTLYCSTRNSNSTKKKKKKKKEEERRKTTRPTTTTTYYHYVNDNAL